MSQENSLHPKYTKPLPKAVAIYPNMPRRIAFWSIGVFAIFLRLITVPFRCFSKKSNTYLVYEPYGMGDVIALQPFVLALANSGSKVIVAVKEEWQEILPKHENVKLVPTNVSYSKYRNKKIGLFKTLISTVRILRCEARGAVALDIRGDVRSICLMYLAGCSKIESFNRYFTANDCRVPLGSVSKRVKIDRTLLRYELNKLLLPKAALEKFTFSDLSHLIDPATAQGLPAETVALVPLAGWDGKEWIPEAWKELISKLNSSGKNIAVVYGPNEQEKAMSAVGTTGVKFVEAVAVKEWVNILNSASCVISVNTGPMHIAAALKKPQIVIEGTSRIPLWAPANSNAIVIHYQNGIEIRAIHQIDSNAEYSRRVMSKISADEVFSVMEKLLKKE